MQTHAHISNLWRTALLFIALLCCAPHARAHEVRPAFLEIRETGPAIYEIFWKTPAQGNLRLALNVTLPADCKTVGQVRSVNINAAIEQRWRSKCTHGLEGRTVGIENLQSSLTDTILRYIPSNNNVKTIRILGSNPIAEIPTKQSPWAIASTYTHFGIEHILSGLDHLLFVFCLVLLLNFRKRLFWAVTAFTLAHSLTLALTALDIVRLPNVPVEALIALSIAYLAQEILRIRDRRGSITKWPWIATFAFGLLHGFGFASALRDIGLPDGAIATALLFFNIGVELGQVAFILCLLIVFNVWRKYVPTQILRHTKILPYCIGILAAYWFIERVIAIF